MLFHQAFELADELEMARSVQIGLHPLLQRRQPELFELRYVRLGERLERKISEWRPLPERQCFAQQLGPSVRFRALGTLQQGVEDLEVESSRGDVEPIARRLRLEKLRPERLTQLRDEVLQRGNGRSRRLLTPERIDQPVLRDNPTGFEQQQGEHCALLQPAEEERTGLVRDLEGSEDPKLKHVTFVTRFDRFEQRCTGGPNGSHPNLVRWR